MPEDYNLAFVNPYNDKLRERNYLLEHMDIITHNPEMLGGGRVRDRPLSGNNGAYPLDRERLMELQAMGGAFNLTKFLRPTMKVLKSKQAQAIIRPLTDEVVRRGVKYAVGGKINRLKKAKRWTGYAVDTVSKGLDLGSKAKHLFGYGELEDVARKVVRRGKKVLAEPLVQEVIRAVRKAPVVRRVEKKVKSVVGGGRAERAAIVKKVMKEHGLGMIAASSFVKKNGLY
jgi:hypothetical protein